MSRKYALFAPSGMLGIWRGVNNMVPMRSGAYRPGNLLTTHCDLGGSPLTSPGTALRAWAALLPDDTATSYWGTTTKLWQYNGGTDGSAWTDRSVGGGYTNTATDWSFAQYGNITFATNRVDALQTRDSSGSSAFANAAGSPPKARIVLTQAEQVLLFDLNDGAEKPDAFATCAPGDYTDWSGVTATTATRIRHRPGKITAAVAFRDVVLVFKQTSVYRLTYTGNSTFKWKVELIAMGIGCKSKHDALVCGSEVIFTGVGGAWRYDGASFTRISEYLGDIGSQSDGSVYYPRSEVAYFYRKSSLAASAYNLVSDRWGSHRITNGSSDYSSGYAMLTGEPAAIDTLISQGTTTDTLYIGAPASLIPVAKSTVLWGAASGASGDVPYLQGHIDSGGRDVVLTLTRIYVDYGLSQVTFTSSQLPAATEVECIVYGADAKDIMASSNGATTLQTITSSTAQRRFDAHCSSPCLMPRIRLPSGSGYTEIDDYEMAYTRSVGKI